MLRAALGIVESETASASARRPMPDPSLSRNRGADAGCARRPEPVATAPVDSRPVSVVRRRRRCPPRAEPDRAAVEPEAENEYGWSREDTDEFEPVSALPDPEPDAGSGAAASESRCTRPEPVLQRISGPRVRAISTGANERGLTGRRLEG